MFIVHFLQQKGGASDQVDIVEQPSEPPPNTGKVTRDKV